MALWVNEQLLAMRDYEVAFFVGKSERDDAKTQERQVSVYVTCAKMLFGVTINPEHVVRTVGFEDDKTQKWTYAWQPATGAAYIPQYEREFTLKTLTYSLPKGLVKLRVRDELKLTMEDDSRRDRYFRMSSWDDANDRWIYQEVEYQ